MQLMRMRSLRDIKTQFNELSDFDKQFLGFLAQHGGACSRKDAALAMNFNHISQANGLLDRLYRQGWLHRKICQDLEGLPVIYSASNSTYLANGLCKMSIKDFEELLTKTYRFAIAVKNKGKGVKSNISASVGTHLLSDTDGKFLIDALPFETLAVLRKRLNALSVANSSATFELWSPSQKYLTEVANSLPSHLKARLCGATLYQDRLFEAYEKQQEAMRYADFGRYTPEDADRFPPGRINNVH